MEFFDPSGHLTDEALDALVQEAPLSELHRLEAAEHLAYCDACLQRYTDLVCGAGLRIPAHSCQENLWRRIQRRTLHLLTSRYATAAAGVALMIAVLWGGTSLPDFRHLPQDPPAISQQMQAWPEQLTQTFDRVLDGLNGIFQHLGGTRYEP